MSGRTAGAIAWAAAAALFATLLASVFPAAYIGVEIKVALVLVVALAAAAPRAALPLLGALGPVAGYVAYRFATRVVAWPDVLVAASLLGFSVNALTPWGRSRRVQPALSVPAIVLGALVVASIVVSLGVMRLRLGPVFTEVLVSYLTRDYFVDLRSFPALHTGLLLLEGLMLFAIAARESEAHAALMTRITRAAAAGAALAGAINVVDLLNVSARGDDPFWATLVRYVSTLRWNVHDPDYNAAGSAFLLGALLACAAAVAQRGLRRGLWSIAAVMAFTGMWLTGSRAAVLAGFVGLAGAFAIRQLGHEGTRRLRRAVLVGAAACIVGVLLTIALPHRGLQKSTFTAADVRLGLVETSARMIANYPVFGIGVSEFYRRSGEFSSPELIALFPVAVHENAHNNFLQVATELGLAGGLAFGWLVLAILALATRGAARAPGASETLTCAAITAFVITWLGGHPLLVAPVAFVFWIVAGAVAGGVTAIQQPLNPVRRWPMVLTVALVVIALTVPARMRAVARETDFEHVGIGVSPWTDADDTDRYRTATDTATLFVPADSGFRFGVKPLTDREIPLELRLNGRVADVVALAPNQWNQIVIPPRSQRPESRYRRMDLRLVAPPDRSITIRMTKVQPIEAR